MLNVRVSSRPRFNVLLTEDRERAAEHWSHQLPRLLRPQGVQAYLARTGREAIELLDAVPIHAAVVDVATPTGEPASAGGSPRTVESAAPGGFWLLEVVRRLPARPPVVVVNHAALSSSQSQRLLNEALRLGAFSVVNRPDDLDDLLAVFRRLLDRQYHGQWPVSESETSVF